MGLRILAISIVLVGVARAEAPTGRTQSGHTPSGYKCGPGGRVLKGKGCACPKGKVDARDADGKAICAPKPPPAPTACLKERTGRHVVKLDTQPQGAVIFLGDKACGAVGTTPWTGKLEPGPVNVIVERHSYEPQTRLFEVTKSTRAQELVIPLARTNIGTVRILADADPNVRDAEVRIDDEVKGKAPIDLQVRGGRRKLELRKDGFKPFTQWLEVVDAVTMNVMPMLVRPEVVTGKLFVDADVPGAEVTLDGARRGTTPLVIDNLPAGTYTVEVTKPPAKPFTTKVEVGRGETAVRATLAGSVAKATAGTLRVTSLVPAELTLDGKVIGVTPVAIDVAAGEYLLRATAAGYYPWEKRIAIEAGKQLAVAVPLARSARLTVTSTPAGASVFLDGRRYGATPYAIDLVAGKYTIIVEKPGFQRHTVELDLQADKALDVTLKR